MATDFCSFKTSFLLLAQPNQFFYSGSGNIVWRSTALYAKAGTIVTLTFPEIAIGKLEVSQIRTPKFDNQTPKEPTD